MPLAFLKTSNSAKPKMKLPTLRIVLQDLIRSAIRLSNSRVFVGCICLAGLFSLAFIVYFGSQELKNTDKVSFFRIATGPTSGTYFSVGKTLASVISHPPGAEPCEVGGRCGVPGLIAIAQTTPGSVTNMRSVNAGQFESGLAQADVVYASFWSKGVFDGAPPLDRVRVIANLYREAIHLVARYDSDINSVEDLRNKRVSLDIPGSGTHADAIAILEAFGLDPADIQLRETDASTAADQILDDRLDAFFLISGPPNPSVTNLADRGAIRLIPINGEPAEKLIRENNFFSPITLPAQLYKYSGEIETLGVGASWIVNETVDDDLVYEILRALFNPANSERLRPATGHISLSIDDAPIFLHPGAKRYYLEAGMIDN